MGHTLHPWIVGAKFNTRFLAASFNGFYHCVIIGGIIHHNSHNLRIIFEFWMEWFFFCHTLFWILYSSSIDHTTAAMFSPECAPINSRKSIKSSSRSATCYLYLILSDHIGKLTITSAVVHIMSNNCQESIKITRGPCVKWEADLAVQILNQGEKMRAMIWWMLEKNTNRKHILHFLNSLFPQCHDSTMNTIPFW